MEASTGNNTDADNADIEDIVSSVPVGKKRKKHNQIETGGNKSISVPSKKPKTAEEAPKSTSVPVAPRPRPVSKGRKPAGAPPASKAGNSGNGSKKRSSLTDDEDVATDTTPKDPKLPMPPLKKAKTAEEARKSVPVAPHPRPIPKGAKPATAAPQASNAGNISKGPNSGLTDNEEVAAAPDSEDPKLPTKKPRVNNDDKIRKGNSSKPQPLRRSGIVNLNLKC